MWIPLKRRVQLKQLFHFADSRTLSNAKNVQRTLAISAIYRSIWDRSQNLVIFSYWNLIIFTSVNFKKLTILINLGGSRNLGGSYGSKIQLFWAILAQKRLTDFWNILFDFSLNLKVWIFKSTDLKRIEQAIIRPNTLSI